MQPALAFLASADYVLWWLREGRLPAPTLTTSSQASQGLLDKADTRVLYGDDRLRTRHGDECNGVRFTLAYWFDDARTVGVEGNAFFLERDSTHYKATSDGSDLLARPYVNPDGSPASYVVAGDAPDGLRSGGFVGYSASASSCTAKRRTSSPRWWTATPFAWKRWPGRASSRCATEPI